MNRDEVASEACRPFKGVPNRQPRGSSCFICFEEWLPT